MSKNAQHKIVIPAKVFFIAIAVLFVILIIFIIILANQSLVSKPQEQSFDPSSNYIFTGTGFMYTNAGSVIYDDLTDTSNNYSGKLPHGDMELSGYGRNTHAVYNAGTLCIIGLENAITTDGIIKNVQSGNEYIACLTEHENSEHISVYNIDGELVEEIDPGNTVTLFGFTHTAKEQLYMVTLDTDSETPISTITTYDPSVPAMTGIITVQNQLVESVVFTQKSIFVEGTTNIIRYDANDNKESYRLIKHGYHVSDHYVNGDKVYFIMYNNTESGAAAHIYATSQSSVPSEQILPLQIPSDSLSVFMCDNSIYAITRTDVYVYDKNCKQIDSEPLKLSADTVYHLDDNNLLFISGNKAYSLTVTGTNKIRSMFKK